VLLARALIVGLSAVLPVAAVAAENIIPAAFRGDWAPTLGDCRDIEPVIVMHIASHAVTFYEARPDPIDFLVETVPPRHIRALAQLSGEGSRWPVRLDFEIAADGRSLIWSGYGRDPSSKNRDMRCPS